MENNLLPRNKIFYIWRPKPSSNKKIQKVQMDPKCPKQHILRRSHREFQFDIL